MFVKLLITLALFGLVVSQNVSYHKVPVVYETRPYDSHDDYKPARQDWSMISSNANTQTMSVNGLLCTTLIPAVVAWIARR